MKKLLWTCLMLITAMACSPTNQNEEQDHENERDYMMDDDMMQEERMEEEEIEDDSLKNRDMMSGIFIKDQS